MYELRVSVKKAMGVYTAHPPLQPGDFFTVNNGDLQVPAGGFICLWALQSMIPVLTPKERKLAEEDDWMEQVHHVQCPDPEGRVIFKIERTKTISPPDGDEGTHCPPSARSGLPRDHGDEGGKGRGWTRDPESQG